jgi:hypothetical protein
MHKCILRNSLYLSHHDDATPCDVFFLWPRESSTGFCGTVVCLNESCAHDSRRNRVEGIFLACRHTEAAITLTLDMDVAPIPGCGNKTARWDRAVFETDTRSAQYQP